MNTPLNDALKPCPFCGGEAEFERMGDPGQSCIVVCRSCSTRHESSDEGLQNGSSWNDRANTPESSAAQGAMTGAEIRCEKCGGSVCNIFGVESSVMCNDCDHIQNRAAQPSDATAQPRVDLTDVHLGEIASEAFHHALSGGHMFDLYKMPKRSEIRALLANTAQGKTDRITCPRFGHICNCGEPCLPDAALAAKKG